MGNNKKDGGLFERFLIMMFGLAIVLLGAYPLSREYGGIRKYLASKGDQLARFYDSSLGEAGRIQSKRVESTSRKDSTSRSRLGTSVFPEAKKAGQSNSNYGLGSLFDFDIFGRSVDKAGSGQADRQATKNAESSVKENLPLDKVSVEDKKQLDDLIQNVVD